MRVHVVVVQGRLLLVVQVLIEGALIRLVYLIYLVHVGMHMVDIVSLMISIVVLMVGGMIVAIVKISGKVTIIVLVVPRIAIAISVCFDESQTDSEDDVETGRELNLAE